jgi:hypothetical protein
VSHIYFCIKQDTSKEKVNVPTLKPEKKSKNNPQINANQNGSELYLWLKKTEQKIKSKSKLGIILPFVKKIENDSIKLNKNIIRIEFTINFTNWKKIILPKKQSRDF